MALGRVSFDEGDERIDANFSCLSIWHYAESISTAHAKRLAGKIGKHYVRQRERATDNCGPTWPAAYDGIPRPDAPAKEFTERRIKVERVAMCGIFGHLEAGVGELIIKLNLYVDIDDDKVFRCICLGARLPDAFLAKCLLCIVHRRADIEQPLVAV